MRERPNYYSLRSPINCDWLNPESCAYIRPADSRQRLFQQTSLHLCQSSMSITSPPTLIFPSSPLALLHWCCERDSSLPSRLPGWRVWTDGVLNPSVRVCGLDCGTPDVGHFLVPGIGRVGTVYQFICCHRLHINDHDVLAIIGALCNHARDLRIEILDPGLSS